MVMFVVVFLAYACNDDETFTLSGNGRLAFVQDTIRLDTVFSTVPSSTRSFWVYNRAKEGVRCSSVRLENGSCSGFRVNVDGVYLSEEQGYAAYNIDIHGKDSIRVFVELTSHTNGGDGPVRIGDNIVFMLDNGHEQKVALDAWSWDAQFVRDMKVEGPATLESGRPLVVYGMITVEEGGVLTIPAGTTVYFHDNAGIEVKGRLLCKGTPGSIVVLRGDRLDHMFDYLPYDRMSGQWKGVHFATSSYANEMSCTDLHGAYDGIVVDSSDVNVRTLDLMNSTIHNCQGNAIGIANSNVAIENCQLTNALGHCLFVDGGMVSVNSSTIAQFYPFSALRGEAMSFSGLDHQLVSLKVTNSLVTGYSDDEVVGLKPATEGQGSFVYCFANCVLRTPEPTDEEKPNYIDVVYEDVKDTVSCGSKNFVLIDGGMQRYDFHLRGGAAAIGKASVDTSAKSDHDGLQRDEKPDVGAYEYFKEEK